MQNATLFYRSTCIQGRRHLVTAVLLSSGDSFPHLIQKRSSQLGFVTCLLKNPRTCRNRARSFSVATRKWFVQPIICGSILGGVKVLYFIQNVHSCFAALPSPCSVGAVVLVGVCKVVGH
jgi:hypothetical protein